MTGGDDIDHTEILGSVCIWVNLLWACFLSHLSHPGLLGYLLGAHYHLTPLSLLLLKMYFSTPNLSSLCLNSIHSSTYSLNASHFCYNKLYHSYCFISHYNTVLQTCFFLLLEIIYLEKKILSHLCMLFSTWYRRLINKRCSLRMHWMNRWHIN